MGKRCRFVQPGSERLAISNGDWIEVRRYLSIGESRDSLKQSHEFSEGGRIRPRLDTVGLAEVHAYIVDWSFQDAAGRRVPVSLEAINQLHQDDFLEVDSALDAHKQAMEVLRAAEKNGQDGEPNEPATSPSAA